MKEYYSIAIDGPSGAGKSSLAKRIAAGYGIIYVDTGAIYRTVGLAAYQRGISCKDEKSVIPILPQLDVNIAYNEAGEQRMFLDGKDVSKEIRFPEISICASDISALPSVRSFLLDMQRSLAKKNNVIMDGRDIGTVVLPDADLKIFLTASPEARAERRLKELQQKNIETTFEEVLKDISYRDTQDSTRSAAPLKPAEDSVYVDTSSIGFEESYELLCSIIKDKLGVLPLKG